MTRVIHTGDTHLGYQQYHVPERREDFLRAFEQVIEDAVSEDVDAVVHAGDLFHDRRPTLTDVLGTLEVLRTLDDADIPFLAVVGNHEAKRDAQWLDLFASLGLATRLDDEPEVVGNTAFYGLDFVPRSQREDLEYDFADHDADHAALVTHGLFEPFDLGEWDAAEVLTESSVDFDAMLLGDNHDPGKKELEGAWVTYCGSTERASAAERADRGYNIVTFDGDVGISRRGLDTRAFVFVEVELAEKEGVERVRERVGEHDLTDAVVIVSVDGEGEPIPPADVEAYALDEGALVARVTDRREFETETEVSVSFADPDEAVRERVRELGLSRAARDIDETIRASKVADSNVADRVQDAVGELLEAEEPELFEQAPDPDVESDADPADGQSSEARADARSSDAQVDDQSSEARADTRSSEAQADDEPSEAQADDEPSEAQADDEPSEAQADDEPGVATADGEPDEATADGEADDGTPADEQEDTQSTMGEFL